MMMNTIISLFVYLLIDSDYDDSYCVRVSGHVGVCVCIFLYLLLIIIAPHVLFL